MRIQKVSIRNFRLLSNVELALEPTTTVIVGRNNSGKTSLAEVIKRFLADGNPSFRIEDFSSACYDQFIEAREAKLEGKDDAVVRELLPVIGVRFLFEYDLSDPNLGPMSDFVVDLDQDCNQAIAEIQYALADGKIDALLEGQSLPKLNEQTKPEFLRVLKERIPQLFTVKLWAEDPNDKTNRRNLPISAIRGLLRSGFINAQRGLDDVTSRDNDVLAEILERLFATAMSPTAAADDKLRAESLQEAVRSIQSTMEKEFNTKLETLFPALDSFGYPGLSGPRLKTETVLDVKRLLSNHTKVRYSGHGGVSFPESYNGLGARNLIFILLELVRFYKSYSAEPEAPGMHLIFIEEPEAHLHPQMQEVFIRQLSEISKRLGSQEQGSSPWPVQFVVSTHSSHIANEAGFEAIRYFLASSNGQPDGVRSCAVKDLSVGLAGEQHEDRNFLHQYLTLTRCDLFFADKAILVEGVSERLILPAVIKKLEEVAPDIPKLTSQYVTIMEVGGAYAHLFYGLLDFLEVRHVVITDLDPVAKVGSGKPKACVVHLGTKTSNACINQWFKDEQATPAQLIAKSDAEKVKGRRRIAYQKPEVENGPCGRTFEDAFILANPKLFKLATVTSAEQEVEAREIAAAKTKANFALEYAIKELVWTPPRYIVEAMCWLAQDDSSVTEVIDINKTSNVEGEQQAPLAGVS
ncbi:ATP-dependent endonuclease [Myxococcus sp. AB036A]|uniref:ATP-dependent nuclease n=1 Tax=Myxococcus sp. AB036A TaxID=2562793 RepID=UPI0011466DF6|nr:ATP-dependent endonuclease [Myxococcus sp. AB036A]